MLMRFKYLGQHPCVFRSVTGLTIEEFDKLLVELWPFFEAHEAKRLARPGRIRAPGAGHPFGDLAYRGMKDLRPAGLAAHPRRKPRGKPRSEENRAYNKAFAQQRIVVEHGICRLRHSAPAPPGGRSHRGAWRTDEEVGASCDPRAGRGKAGDLLPGRIGRDRLKGVSLPAFLPARFEPPKDAGQKSRQAASLPQPRRQGAEGPSFRDQHSSTAGHKRTPLAGTRP